MAGAIALVVLAWGFLATDLVGRIVVIALVLVWAMALMVKEGESS